MDPSMYVQNTVMAIAAHFIARGMEMSLGKAKELIENFLVENPTLRGQVDADELAESILRSAGQIGLGAYNDETLARYLEVPRADLKTISVEDLDTQTLYDHVRLEGSFSEWLREWGYEVERGEILMGAGGVEYTADVYGKLDTLHGEFEICINFVCDDPPNEYRVIAMLGQIEAYSEAKTNFSHADIFIIASPHRFTHGASNAMDLQNLQEDYSVLALTGGDIHTLETAKDRENRLEELQDKVREAQEEANNGEKV